MQPFYSFVKSFLINLTNFLSKPTRFLSLRFAQKRDYEQALPCGQVVFLFISKMLMNIRQIIVRIGVLLIADRNSITLL
jgi:hypothetical protein